MVLHCTGFLNGFFHEPAPVPLYTLIMRVLKANVMMKYPLFTSCHSFSTLFSMNLFHTQPTASFTAN